MLFWGDSPTDPEWNGRLKRGDDDVAEIHVFGEHHKTAASYSMKTSSSRKYMRTLLTGNAPLKEPLALSLAKRSTTFFEPHSGLRAKIYSE